MPIEVRSAPKGFFANLTLEFLHFLVHSLNVCPEVSVTLKALAAVFTFLFCNSNMHSVSVPFKMALFPKCLATYIALEALLLEVDGGVMSSEVCFRPKGLATSFTFVLGDGKVHSVDVPFETALPSKSHSTHLTLEILLLEVDSFEVGLEMALSVEALSTLITFMVGNAKVHVVNVDFEVALLPECLPTGLLEVDDVIVDLEAASGTQAFPANVTFVLLAHCLVHIQCSNFLLRVLIS